MKDVTRTRRLAKLYVAMNTQEISLSDATGVLQKLLPDQKLRSKLWADFMNMTDDARERWLKEITK